jgi:hypothetical protein
MDETHRQRIEATAPGPQQAPPRVLSLSEVAARLRMKPSNVAKYLNRHGVRPAFEKSQGYFWWEAAIDELVERRAGDTEAIEKRRRGALEGAAPRVPAPPRVRLGEHQRALMETMLRRPVPVTNNADRLALRRLRLRGLVEQLEGERELRAFKLTELGRQALDRETQR